MVFWLNTAYDLNINSHIFCVNRASIASSSHWWGGKSICSGTRRSQVQPWATMAPEDCKFPCACGDRLWIDALHESHPYFKAATAVRRRGRGWQSRVLLMQYQGWHWEIRGTWCTFERLLLHVHGVGFPRGFSMACASSWKCTRTRKWAGWLLLQGHKQEIRHLTDWFASVNQICSGMQTKSREWHVSQVSETPTSQHSLG